MLTEVLVVAGQHATVIIGPRPIGDAANQDMTDPARAQLLHFRWVGEESVDVAVQEQLQRLRRRIGDPIYIAHRIETDRGSERGEKHLGTAADHADPNALALQLTDLLNPILGEQLKATDMNP